MEIVINRDFGGFGLSKAQAELLGLESVYDYSDDVRQDPRLIESVKGGDTGGTYSKLEVVNVPDGAHWKLHQYDGSESIIYSQSEIHWV